MEASPQQSEIDACSATGPLGRFRFARFDVAAGTKIRNHSHDNWHVFMMLDGGMEQASGDHGVHVGRAGLRVSSCERRHAIDFGAEGGRCLVLHVADPSLMAGFENIATSSDAFARDVEIVSALADASQRLANIAEAPLAELSVKAALNRLRLSMTRRFDAPPAWLDDARLLIERGDRAVSVASLAAAFGVSREHFTRRFRHHYGFAPSEYLAARRLSGALRLLIDGAGTQAEIAAETGFFDQSHMAHSLRRALGIVPSQIRAHKPN